MITLGRVYWQADLPLEQAKASEMTVTRIAGSGVYFTRANAPDLTCWQSMGQFLEHIPAIEEDGPAEPAEPAPLQLDNLADIDPDDYPPGSTIPEADLRKYAALGRAAEQHGLAWYAPDGKRGEMLFQPPADYIAAKAVEDFIYGNNLKKAEDVPETMAPVPMLLNCPSCGERHIDEGEFATKPHHTHACQGCGMVWRPALVDTVGVRFLPGFKNDG